MISKMLKIQCTWPRTPSSSVYTASGYLASSLQVKLLIHILIDSPLPLPGVPGDREVGLLGLVDFRLALVSAIQALLCLQRQLSLSGAQINWSEDAQASAAAMLPSAYTMLTSSTHTERQHG